MFRDGGWDRFDPAQHTLAEGQMLEEIRLDSPRNKPRYLYLVRNNSERSPADYVEAVAYTHPTQPTTYSEQCTSSADVIQL